MTEIGARVGAMLSASDKRVALFGYGVYLGYEVPEKGVFLMGSVDMHDLKVKNPAILLDSGQKVYGCECWWGDEDEFKRNIEKAVTKGAKIVQASLDDFRARNRAAFEKSQKPKKPRRRRA